MASITRQSNGRRTIQISCPDGKRRSIRLGKIPQRDAESIKLRIERLIASRISGHPLDAEMASWLASIDDTLAEKIAKTGLIPHRKKADSAALEAFLNEYLSHRIDVKPGTREVPARPSVKCRCFQNCFRCLKKHLRVRKKALSTSWTLVIGKLR